MEWKKGAVIILAILICIAFIYSIWSEKAEQSRIQSEFKLRIQNEFEKCEKDFLESMPIYNGSTVIHESADCYLNAGVNITFVAIIGNVTDLKTRSSRTFWGTKEMEDTIFFSDGEEFLLYRAEGRDWRKNKIHKIMAKRYRLGKAGYITGIEVIN